MNEQQVYAEIGHRIRILRRWRGINQLDVAVRMRMSRTSIVNVEAGRQKMPVWNLLQIAAILAVPPHVWLLLPNEWRQWCSEQGVIVKRREYKQVEKVVTRMEWVEVKEKVRP